MTRVELEQIRQEIVAQLSDINAEIQLCETMEEETAMRQELTELWLELGQVEADIEELDAAEPIEVLND